MKSGHLSYRFTPVYMAIAFALAVPDAQAKCAQSGSNGACIINGQQNVTSQNRTTPAINVVANEVVIKTTGSESTGVFHRDFSDSIPDIRADQVSSMLTVVNNTAESTSTANMFTNVTSSQNVLSTVNNSLSHIQFDELPTVTVNALNDNLGMVTIYNSGQVYTSGLPSLVYSDSTHPITITRAADLTDASGLYSRLAASDNIKVHNATTFIGEYNINAHSAYISALTINTYDHEYSNLSPLQRAIALNTFTAHRTLQADRAKTNGIVAVQSLNYILTDRNKPIGMRLLDRFSQLEKPSAIQIGYQVKESIIAGLDKQASDSDGMISIRADQNSISRRLELRGYVINHNPPAHVNYGEANGYVTGNVTIHNADSTKVFINNTALYFKGHQPTGRFDMVNVSDTSATHSNVANSVVQVGLSSRVYDRSQVSINNSSSNL